MTRTILKNSARCLNCHTLLVSKHYGDFHNCSCGQFAINGGTQQIQRFAQYGVKWEELSTYEEESDDAPARKPASNPADDLATD